MSSESQYYFPPFRLDQLNAQLWKGAQKISLTSKTFEVLRYLEELRLRLLSQREVEDYVSQRVAGDNSRQFAALALAIHARTDGNPLFVVNMIDCLCLLDDPGFVVRTQELSEAEWAQKLRANLLGRMRSIREMIESNLEAKL
jgi:hypothetical protein